MNYYIQGNKEKADQIKAAFEKLGYKNIHDFKFKNEYHLYFSCYGEVNNCSNNGCIAYIIKTHPYYKELELPVEPKFKAEDRIVSKSDKSTVYRIIDLHEERREYIVEIEHKDYHESCPWIAFEDQDDYELAPKPHYDIKNFKPFDHCRFKPTETHDWIYADFWYVQAHYKVEHLSAIEKWES